MSKQNSVVVYYGSGEVFVCAKENEDRMIKFWFGTGKDDRNVEDFDRVEEESVKIETGRPIITKSAL